MSNLDLGRRYREIVLQDVLARREGLLAIKPISVDVEADAPLNRRGRLLFIMALLLAEVEHIDIEQAGAAQ